LVLPSESLLADCEAGSQRQMRSSFGEQRHPRPNRRLIQASSTAPIKAKPEIGFAGGDGAAAVGAAGWAPARSVAGVAAGAATGTAAGADAADAGPS
jgi:hypothetical protein